MGNDFGQAFRAKILSSLAPALTSGRSLGRALPSDADQFRFRRRQLLIRIPERVKNRPNDGTGAAMTMPS